MLKFRYEALIVVIWYAKVSFHLATVSEQFLSGISYVEYSSGKWGTPEPLPLRLMRSIGP
jgi:hypothetical protein